MFIKFYEKVRQFILDNFKFLLVLLLLYLFFWIELPYVIYTPGGAINLDERIVMEDGYESQGKLQMAYVSMVKGSIPFLLTSFVIPDWDIAKKSDLTLEDESMKDMLKKDKLSLDASIDNATIAAYNMVDEKLEITKTHNSVVYITKEAQTDVKLYDEIIRVNNVNINSLDEYKEIVENANINDTLTLKIRRNKKIQEAKIKVYDTENGHKTGISLISTYDYKTQKDIQIKSKASESGPSGGMMLALGIYNSLTKDDITKGKNIVGTGTIDINGNVGEIGGVKYKLIGAVKNKADIFICPTENYQEAKKVAKEKNYDIIIITADNLSEIINQLKNLN